jgi:hypothetical protein
MPVSDRMQISLGSSDSRHPTDLFGFGVTAGGNPYLLDIANDFPNRLLAEENLDEIADLPPKTFARGWRATSAI